MFQGKESLAKFDIKQIKTERKSIKKEKTSTPLSTSYSIPFYFTDSGRRNQMLICEGRKYIQNNKYGDKVYYKCRYACQFYSLNLRWKIKIKFFLPVIGILVVKLEP